MLSLAARRADRIQRKADNAAFSRDETNGNIGNAVNLAVAAQEAISRLSDDERELAMDSLKGVDDGFDPVDRDAYDGKGNLKTAGVGVANPLVAPVAVAVAAEGAMPGNGGGDDMGGWGTPPAPSIDPANGNQNGQAVAEQTDAKPEKPAKATKAATAS